MKRLIALAASVAINAAVLGGLGWDVSKEAPSGSVEVTELSIGGSDIVVAAVNDAG